MSSWRTKRSSEDDLWPTPNVQAKEKHKKEISDEDDNSSSDEENETHEYVTRMSTEEPRAGRMSLIPTPQVRFSEDHVPGSNSPPHRFNFNWFTPKTEKRASANYPRRKKLDIDQLEMSRGRPSRGSISSLASFIALNQQKSVSTGGGAGSNSPKAHHHHRRESTFGKDNDSILRDWNNASNFQHQQGFDLEQWWMRTDMMQRLTTAVMVLCLAIFLLQFGFAIWLIVKGLTEKVRSPYLCETEECNKASVWIGSTINASADPCDNFYEFVCGNYRHETEKKGDQFTSVIKAPAFPVGFGENSLLAKILIDYKNDVVHDQSIYYYQRCLNLPMRKEFGLKAFIDLVEYVFGTRDFSTFETTTTLTMEEIGSRMFRAVGHASFVNMAFFTYPYIQILRPSKFVKDLHFEKFMILSQGVTWNNREFVTRVFKGLMPSLGVPVDSPVLTELIKGVDVMSQIIHKINVTYSHVKRDKDLDKFKNDPEILKNYTSEFVDEGFCPPMGIPMDTMKILQMFIGKEDEDFRLDFIDLMATKFFAILQLCFGEGNKGHFKAVKLTHPKTAFVGLWLLDLFWEYHTAMDTQGIMKAWQITNTDFPNNLHVNERFESTSHDVEFVCLISLYRHLGYMPSILYLHDVTDNPPEYIGKVEDDVTHVFHQFSDIFERIPPTEIVTVGAHLSKIQLARGMLVNVGLPFASGLLDPSAILDQLNFTDDHLFNAIQGTRYTVEKGRQNWIGSTNSFATMKWWGSGGPSDMVRELLDLREPMHMPARFVETDEPAKGSGNWQKFLGRGYPNYILYPLSLIAEPHVSETMAIHHAAYISKLLRSFLSVIEHQFLENRYPSLADQDFVWFGHPETDNGGDRPCYVLYNEIPSPPKELMYQYELAPYDMFNFSWKANANHFSVLSVKEALRMFRKRRKDVLKIPFDWTIPEALQNMRMRRYLPGNVMSKFSEEQLFFITYVRHVCRGSWKTHDDNYEEERWLLETQILCILMQTEEFQRAWRCKNGDFMSNKGLPRCIRWVPD